MPPTELHLTNGKTFVAVRAVRSEKKNGQLFAVYEGFWLHKSGASDTMEVAIAAAHIVSYIEDKD